MWWERGGERREERRGGENKENGRMDGIEE